MQEVWRCKSCKQTTTQTNHDTLKIHHTNVILTRLGTSPASVFPKTFCWELLVRRRPCGGFVRSLILGVVPNVFSMTPRRAIVTTVTANLIIIAFAILLDLVTAGKPSRYFGEGRFTTAFSCAQLLAEGFFLVAFYLANRTTIGSFHHTRWNA
jgi:hypothetical protein